MSADPATAERPDRPRDVFVVTRPGEPGQALAAALTALGESALWVPAFEIGAAPDPGALAATLARLADYQLAIFVSPNAVRAVAAALQGPWPASVAIAAVGAATLQAVRASVPGVATVPLIAPAVAVDPAVAPTGPTADGVTAQAGSEALWAALRGRDWHAARVLLVRAARGREWLGERLRSGGARVDELAAYDRRAVLPSAATIAALHHAAGAGATRCVLVVSSSEAVAALAPLWLAAGLTGWVHAGLAVAIHPRIAAVLRTAGHRAVQLGACDAAALRDLAHATDGTVPIGQ